MRLRASHPEPHCSCVPALLRCAAPGRAVHWTAGRLAGADAFALVNCELCYIGRLARASSEFDDRTLRGDGIFGGGEVFESARDVERFFFGCFRGGGMIGGTQGLGVTAYGISECKNRQDG